MDCSALHDLVDGGAGCQTENIWRVGSIQSCTQRKRQRAAQCFNYCCLHIWFNSQWYVTGIQSGCRAADFLRAGIVQGEVSRKLHIVNMFWHFMQLIGLSWKGDFFFKLQNHPLVSIHSSTETSRNLPETVNPAWRKTHLHNFLSKLHCHCVGKQVWCVQGQSDIWESDLAVGVVVFSWWEIAAPLSSVKIVSGFYLLVLHLFYTTQQHTHKVRD